MNRLAASLVLGFTFSFLFLLPVFAYQLDTSGIVQVTIETKDYTVTSEGEVNAITIPGFGNFIEPGTPKLPSRIYACAIPPGATALSVEILPGSSVVIPGKFVIPAAPVPRKIGSGESTVADKDQKIYSDNYQLVYKSDKPFPSKPGKFIRTASYRRYNLVDVRITPFSYRPQSGTLLYYPRIMVRITYSPPAKPVSDDILYDFLPNTENIAREIVYNYEEAQQWYPAPRMYKQQDHHSLVIITPDSLVQALNSLVAFEHAVGNNPAVVTLSWIDNNFEGVDLAEKTRNFLRAQYPSTQWGIENVLLIGDHTQTPMRMVWVEAHPLTDFYLAELSLPDNESWDRDQDGKYFEYGDNKDFYSEVNVGRIPWNDLDVVKSICQKSVRYRMNQDLSYKKSILLLGAYFWSNTDTAHLMEHKVDQTWMTDWYKTRLYEKNDDFYSTFPSDYPLNHSNVMDIWTSGTYAFVNWAGHGSPTSSHVYGLNTQAFIRTADCTKLSNDFPAIIFADSCSNSDTDYHNLGKKMLKDGAVGFIGATRYAYGCPGWRDPGDAMMTKTIHSWLKLGAGVLVVILFIAGLQVFSKHAPGSIGAIYQNNEQRDLEVYAYVYTEVGDPVEFLDDEEGKYGKNSFRAPDKDAEKIKGK